MKKSQFSFLVQTGKRVSVTGLILGPFGIHKEEDRYIITHLTTGYLVFEEKSQRAALAFIARIPVTPALYTTDPQQAQTYIRTHLHAPLT